MKKWSDNWGWGIWGVKTAGKSIDFGGGNQKCMGQDEFQAFSEKTWDSSRLKKEELILIIM